MYQKKWRICRKRTGNNRFLAFFTVVASIQIFPLSNNATKIIQLLEKTKLRTADSIRKCNCYFDDIASEAKQSMYFPGLLRAISLTMTLL
jgi:hypothetical protein